MNLLPTYHSPSPNLNHEICFGYLDCDAIINLHNSRSSEYYSYDSYDLPIWITNGEVIRIPKPSNTCPKLRVINETIRNILSVF